MVLMWHKGRCRPRKLNSCLMYFVGHQEHCWDGDLWSNLGLEMIVFFVLRLVILNLWSEKAGIATPVTSLRPGYDAVNLDTTALIALTSNLSHGQACWRVVGKLTFETTIKGKHNLLCTDMTGILKTVETGGSSKTAGCVDVSNSLKDIRFHTMEQNQVGWSFDDSVLEQQARSFMIAWARPFLQTCTQKVVPGVSTKISKDM